MITHILAAKGEVILSSETWPHWKSDNAMTREPAYALGIAVVIACAFFGNNAQKMASRMPIDWLKA